MARKVTFKAGVEGGETRDITVEIHDLDAPPWGLDAELRYVGTDVPRVDAAVKATGAARFTYDINLPGLAHVRIKRCFHAHADVLSVDTSQADMMEGVLGVHVLAGPGARCTFAGRGVVAVCAETEEIAEDAVRAVKVKYEVQPHAVTVEQAMDGGAPRVDRKRENVVPSRRGATTRGNPAKALKAARSKVSAEFRTQIQTHSALEPHGCVVAPQDDGSYVVYASTQATGGYRGQMARTLGVPADRVRVVSHHVGGGFGAKFGPGRWAQEAARFAKELKRPVKSMLDRRAEHLIAGNRPDSIQKLEMGVDDSGRISVLVGEVVGTAGNGAGGAGVRNFQTYSIPNLSMTQATVSTFTGSGRAFRAPGSPNGQFALDGIVDMLAVELGEDPLEFRVANDPHPVRQVQWRVGAERIGWKENRRTKPGADAGPVKRGVGCAAGFWFQKGRGNWRVDVEITRDGTVTVSNATQDIGTGTRTLLAIMVAEELGIDPSRVTVRLGDTIYPPGPPSGGSQVSPSIGPAAREAGLRARERLAAALASDWGVKAGEVALADGGFTGPGGKQARFEQACGLLGPDGIAVSGERRKNYDGFEGNTAGCQFAQVAVDVETGVVKVERVVAVHDAGRIVNTLAARSQVIGGVIQGVSYALHEERQLDLRMGDMVNPRLDTYRILGMADCPKIEAVMTKLDSGFNNSGMMGLGEPATVPTAAAVANAVANATGVRITQIPMTPARVLDALRRA